MSPREIALLVETSEARAYASLAKLPLPNETTAHAAARPSVHRFGSAIAVVSPSITSTLNLNRVVGLGVREPADVMTLDSIDQLYRAFGLSYAIELGPCADPPELAHGLRERRLRRCGSTAMVWREATPAPPQPGAPAVRPARTPAEHEALARIACAVFRTPAQVHSLLAATRHDSRWRGWLAWDGATPIAAALSFIDEGVAWFGWDATLPEYRRHGAQCALIAARIDEARAEGCSHITCETAAHTAARPDPSGRNYEKLGFVLAYLRSTYVAMPARGTRSGAAIERTGAHSGASTVETNE